MRIGEKDLELDLLSKVKRLDSVVSSYNDSASDNFVSYNGKDFFIKKINSTGIRKILSEDEIKEALYYINEKDEKGIFESSKFKKFQKASLWNKYFPSALSFPTEKEILFSGQIYLIKKIEKGFIILTKAGKFFEFDENFKEIFSYDLLYGIKTSFNIKDFFIFDIIEIEDRKTSVFIATKRNGVFLLKKEKKQLELKFLLNNVKCIKDVLNGNVLCLNDEEMVFFNFENELKVERNIILKNNFHVPEKIEIENNNIFILSKPIYRNIGKLLYWWEKDIQNLSYNNATGKIFPHPENDEYKIKFLFSKKDYIFIAGLKNKKVFVWKYLIKDMSSFKEIIFDTNISSIDDLKNIEEFEGKYFIFSENLLNIFSEEKEIILNLELPKYEKGYFDNGNIILIDDSSLFLIKQPIINEKNNYSFKILEENISFNELTIFVKGMRATDKFFLLNDETNSEFQPTFSVMYEDTLIIKILNSSLKNIWLNIEKTTEEQIEGIVIKKNRVFLR